MQEQEMSRLIPNQWVPGKRRALITFEGETEDTPRIVTMGTLEDYLHPQALDGVSTKLTDWLMRLFTQQVKPPHPVAENQIFDYVKLLEEMDRAAMNARGEAYLEAHFEDPRVVWVNFSSLTLPRGNWHERLYPLLGERFIENYFQIKGPSDTAYRIQMHCRWLHLSMNDHKPREAGSWVGFSARDFHKNIRNGENFLRAVVPFFRALGESPQRLIENYPAAHIVALTGMGIIDRPCEEDLYLHDLKINLPFVRVEETEE